MDAARYQPTDPSIWSGRASEDKLYFHEIITCVDAQSFDADDLSSVVLIGYQVDEGVKRNQGRTGAVEGPDSIRNRLGKLSNHLPYSTIHDLGNIRCTDGKLEASQEALAALISSACQEQKLPIVLGGGHDIAYANFSGVRHALSGRIGIINLDAHLDLRPPAPQGNSGTPFHQCYELDDTMRYMPIGIQKVSNHRGLLEKAVSINADIIYLHECQPEALPETIKRLNTFIGSVDHIYLTIDMDGFSSAYSPGVSAPSPIGLTPEIAMEIIKNIVRSEKLASMDLAETCPRYDIDQSTARLAALLVNHTLELLGQ